MRIALLMKDERLRECFLHGKDDPDWELTSYDRPETILETESCTEWDAIVISDRFFELTALIEYVERLWDSGFTGKLAVLLSNQHSAEENQKYLKFCLSHELTYTHPGQSLTTIVAEIYRSFSGGKSVHSPARRGRTVVFVGSTPNIGTTLTAFGTAAQMAMRTQQTVAYLCLNLKSSKIHKYLGIDQPLITLDEIRPELKSMSLERQRLKQCCEKIKGYENLYVLFGNMLREQAEYYSSDDMDYLLKLAADTFDVCLVEVNAYWDNAATVCAVLHADTRVVVTTRQLACFQEDVSRWIQTISPVFGVDVASFDLFVTRQQEFASNGGFHLKDVRRETGMSVIGGMRTDPRAEEMLNQGRILDLVRGKTVVAQDLGRMANTLASLHRLPKKEMTQQKTGFRKFISKLGTAQK